MVIFSNRYHIFAAIFSTTIKEKLCKFICKRFVKLKNGQGINMPRKNYFIKAELKILNLYTKIKLSEIIMIVCNNQINIIIYGLYKLNNISFSVLK